LCEIKTWLKHKSNDKRKAIIVHLQK